HLVPQPPCRFSPPSDPASEASDPGPEAGIPIPVDDDPPVLEQVIDSLPYTIDTPGTYVLGADLATGDLGTGAAISVEADGVVLDLDGHVLDGSLAPNAFGVRAVGRRELTIRNGTLRGFRRAVSIEGTSQGPPPENWVESLSVSGSGEAGLWVEGAGSVVYDCHMSSVGGGPGNAYGIVLAGAQGMLLANEVTDVSAPPDFRAYGLVLGAGPGSQA